MGRGLQKSDYMDGEPYDNDGNGNPERKDTDGKVLGTRVFPPVGCL